LTSNALTLPLLHFLSIKGRSPCVRRSPRSPLDVSDGLIDPFSRSGLHSRLASAVKASQPIEDSTTSLSSSSSSSSSSSEDSSSKADDVDAATEMHAAPASASYTALGEGSPERDAYDEEDGGEELNGDYDEASAGNLNEDDEGDDGTVIVGGEPLELGEGEIEDREGALRDEALGPANDEVL
jgi:hypothetical protein